MLSQGRYRERILELRRQMGARCGRLDAGAIRMELLHGFVEAVATQTQPFDDRDASGLSGGGVPMLQVLGGRTPLHLWDWRVWPQATPQLWRYGNAVDLYKDDDRDQAWRGFLTSQEWTACLLTRETMEHGVCERGAFSTAWLAGGYAINCFAGDSLTQHLFQPVYMLCDQKHSTFALLKNGGMAFAQRVRPLSHVYWDFETLLQDVSCDAQLRMRLFFLHAVGVRPECLRNRRGESRTLTQEWCADGVAAASTSMGIVGFVLAFEGEVEAQGRGSITPHTPLWLGASSLHFVLILLQRDNGRIAVTDKLRSRL